jgi:hypothetical protein
VSQGPNGPRYGADPPPGDPPRHSRRLQQPADPYPYPSEPYASDLFPSDRFPSAGYPSESYQSDRYPSDAYPSNPYLSGSYSSDSEATGPLPAPVPQAPPQQRYYQTPQQPQFDPAGGYPRQPQEFRNPRTGSDYHRGDDFTMPAEGRAPSRDRLALTAAITTEKDKRSSARGGLPPAEPPRRGRRAGRVKRRRIRRFFGRPVGRVLLGILLICCCWLAFSLGQALTAAGGGTPSSRLAEWARDHYLGPVITFGEWLTYQPPKVGGKPEFSLANPQGKLKYTHERGFVPDIPKALVPFASPALPGEGDWRLVETVHGDPALFTTFLRVDSVHTSYVAGLASFDQRLVTFQLHPGAEDPGQDFGGVPSWIPPGSRAGLVATFNGGFKLDSAGGGFYLNGATRGTLVPGAASVVYYRDGTIKVGEWGRDVSMSSDVAGVRQNLKLIVDQGQVPASVNQDVETSWGATLGGDYYVWRSGIGETKDGRIIFVYGPSLSVHSLADLLQRAGAVEGMQLDINPYWMSFEYYKGDAHPDNPNPVMLLPTQQQSAYRYYSIYSRDFTAVHAR